MDIASLSMSMSQINLQENVGISLLKMNMNNEENTTQFINQMMDNMPKDENLGNIIDSYVWIINKFTKKVNNIDKIWINITYWKV